MLESVTQAALSSALDGLALRQKTIANNVANINTPNYHAGRVQFEDALASSISERDGHVAPSVLPSLEPTQLNGNNVNLDEETLNNIETVLRYQFATQAMNYQFKGIQAALRSA